MPRPWSDVVQVIYPWLVCLASALSILALCACGGCHMPGPDPVHGRMVTAPLSEPDYVQEDGRDFQATAASIVHAADGSTPRYDGMCVGKYRPPVDGKPGLFVLVMGSTWTYAPGDASPEWYSVAIAGVCFDPITGEVFPPSTVHVAVGDPATEPYAWNLCEVGLFYRYLPGCEPENRMRVVAWDAESIVLEMEW